MKEKIITHCPCSFCVILSFAFLWMRPDVRFGWPTTSPSGLPLSHMHTYTLFFSLLTLFYSQQEHMNYIFFLNFAYSEHPAVKITSLALNAVQVLL